jgi:hypothetical protein
VTVNELVARCRMLIAANERAYVEPETLAMARAIVDILGVEAPCGAEDVDVVTTKYGTFVVWANDEQIRPDEVRGLCAQYLRAADRCDAALQQGERDVDKS